MGLDITGTGIQYNFPALQALADTMRSQSRNIDDQNSAIASVVANLQASWDGAGAVEWNDAQNRWGEGSRELNEVLELIARATGQGSEDMHTADRAAASRFGNR
ncbi:WXG100 family type VII secretion target [Rhodococcus sp. 27YEA15]|uniref:WXG100 family type VII secretion target n=1 Tax=Rhodococcus sp. 27YEA15 TaxID=3156259 RepID=UPI003C7B9CA0